MEDIVLYDTRCRRPEKTTGTIFDIAFFAKKCTLFYNNP